MPTYLACAMSRFYTNYCPRYLDCFLNNLVYATSASQGVLACKISVRNMIIHLIGFGLYDFNVAIGVNLYTYKHTHIHIE